MFFRFVIISFVVMMQVSYAQTQQDLNQETLLRQQQARIQRQVERDKLQKEIASEQSDLLSDFQEKEAENEEAMGSDKECFTLKSITYQNSTILSKRQKLKLSQGFIGKCITPKLLTQITRKITNFYIDRGYVTTRAFVNPQNIKTGMLEILIMEGKLESIEFDSGIKNFFTLSQITHAFGRIKGKILNIRDIEQGLDQLNRLSSNNATMKIVPSQKQGYSKIIISKNKQSRTTRVRLGANNSGQKQTGLYNGKIILEQDNFFKLSDSIYAVYTHDLADRSEDRNSKNLYTSINIPFGYWNFSTSYIDSTYLNTIQGTNTTIKTSGKSTFNTFKLMRKIFRNKKNKVGLFTSLDLKNTKSYVEDVINDVGSRKLSIMKLGLNHSINSSKYGYFNYTLAHVFGITNFGAKEDIGALDEFTPHAQYKKYTLDISCYKPFKLKNQSFYFQSYLSSQYSEDPLFSSEQIIIGDQYSVRGYREKSVLGDSGFYVTNNINYQLPPFLSGSFDVFNLNKTLQKNRDIFRL